MGSKWERAKTELHRRFPREMERVARELLRGGFLENGRLRPGAEDAAMQAILRAIPSANDLFFPVSSKGS